MKPTFNRKFRMQHLIFAVMVFLLVTTLTYLVWSDNLLIKRISCKLYDRHIVNVQTDDHLDIKDVSIKWISSKGAKYIFRNGQKINRIDYLDGDYAFQIYYKDTLVNEVGHCITQWDHNNNYLFQLSQMNGIVSTSFKVIGPDTIPPLYWNEVLHPSSINPSKINKSDLFYHSETDPCSRNVIDLNLSLDDYYKIEENTPTKHSFKNARLFINNHPAELKKVKIAGATSLKYRRKSYKVSLEKPCPFSCNGTTFELEDFRLISLSMDPYYFHMFIAYGLMQEAGLFDLYFSYVELKINEQTQGIYLLVEDPEHFALNRKKSSFVLRRDFRHSLFASMAPIKEFDYKCNPINSQFTDDERINSFESIYASLHTAQNEALFESLNKRLDVNKYMKWMAMNYLLCNSDYTDELFFFAKSIDTTTYFDIIPWDYDDILRMPPHEGWEHRHAKIGNKLIYSIEDSLDLKIANDEFLYSQYLNILASLLETIDDDLIKRLFNQAAHELAPFLKSDEIISMSRYDKTTAKNHEEFILNLNASYLFLIERKKIINDRLTRYAQLNN